MVILAFETVTRAGSIALLDGAACHAMVGDPATTHAERLPGELTAWLTSHGRTLDSVDQLAVVTGPGSFTGLRVGIAVAQGLALAGHKRVSGVPTLEALAASWPAGEGDSELLVACVDGQRGDVFFAVWRRDPGQPAALAPMVVEPAVGTVEDAARQIDALGADLPVVAIGDGAVRYADRWRTRPRTRVGEVTMTLAESAARLAAAQPERAGAPHALRPIYIRRPDAELARDRARRSRASTTPAPSEVAAFVVRRASTPEDLADVAALQQSTFTNPWAADAIRWELENTDVARLYVMREPGGALVGFCACWMIFDELHVNSFAVTPSWRRRGAATRLLRTVFAEALASGATSATLEVRASNVAARRLYEKLGFSVEGIRRDYYQAPREDALVLWHRGLATETFLRADTGS
jgi:tRNA threonylcarbamoyl adenosine modification protein YeaZ/ribosomal-protein-alanine acetyltransferase